MKKIALIPARGGSKRIPRKNIKLFCGKPIIAYPIELALNCGLFDRVIVSTDDEEIAQISKDYGAEVPYFRSSEASSDYASTVDVLLEFLEKYEGSCDILCCLYPTTPLLQGCDLVESFARFEQGGFDSLIPVTKFSYPPQRALEIDETGLLGMEHPENLNSRSQDLRPLYHDAGQFYWIKTDELVSQGTLFTKNCGAYVLGEIQVQDIDNISDWEIAELKYQLIRNRYL